MTDMTLAVRYTNWRGETADRVIEPIRIWWGNTEWHPENQWMLEAKDVEKNAVRDFALRDMVLQPDLIPASDARLAVAAAYQRAADGRFRATVKHEGETPAARPWYEEFWAVRHDAILALAPADDLAEVAALQLRPTEVSIDVSVFERLQAAEAEVARLREALTKIEGLDDSAECCGVGIQDGYGPPECCGMPIYGIGRALLIARAALQPTTPEDGKG